MSSPIHAVLTGTFTSDGLTRNITLPSGYNDFKMINITDIGSAAAATPVMRAQATSSMLAGSAYYSTKTNGAATLDLETTTLTGGFTFIDDSASTPIGPILNIATGVSKAAPAVVTTNVTTNLNNGDIVRIYGTTGMLQIAGMDFTISLLNSGVSYDLAYLDSTGFANVATAGKARKVAFDSRYYPKSRFITNISQAANAIVTMSVTHGYTVGQQVRIYCTANFGMTEINGLLGTIIAIGTADTSGFTNTITLDIDSSAFTAFTFPTSAVAALGVTFPQVVPVGEAAINTVTEHFANLLDDATRNISFRGVQIGTTVQTTAKVYQWIATKGTAI